MFYTYIIESAKNGELYSGYTEDLQKRIKEHNQGLVKSTKAYRPYSLFYKEVFSSKTEARKREIEIKKKGQEKEKIIRGYK